MNKVFCKNCKEYFIKAEHNPMEGGIVRRTYCNSSKNIKINYEIGEKTACVKSIDELNKEGDCRLFNIGIPTDNYEIDKKRIEEYHDSLDMW